MQDPTNILQQYWGYPGFRGLQKEIIGAVLEGKDTLALMPTGGGKSICFQVPAMMRSGLCLVVTPLIALMNDQVSQLNAKGIPAAALHTGMNRPEILRVYEELEMQHSELEMNLKFLYVSPERLGSERFISLLESISLQLIVVDEAHCIAQWGYDFRPAYLQIGQVRAASPNTPVIALTASATSVVQADIVDKLKLRQPAIFQQNFTRPNLSYQVVSCDDKYSALQDYMQRLEGRSAIIYTRSRILTQQVTEVLRGWGYSADFYHAGLAQEVRAAKQQAWMNNEVPVMVCTNAFGMGINKADVRLVLHFGLTDCIEHYYQEAGRCGRDGAPAAAVMIYDAADFGGLKALPQQRYPKFSVIQTFYQHLADYLQIPVGIGEGRFFAFDLMSFARAFKWHPMQVHSILRSLEQAGLLSYLEQVYMPAKVQVRVTRKELELITASYPELQRMADYLSRSFNGIFMEPVTIKEKQIAWDLYVDFSQVKQELALLHQRGLIRYLPARHSPQLYFLTNRAPAKSMSFNHAEYQRQRQLFEQRLEAMVGYLYTNICRSQYIATYFGQENTPPCGQCDNCQAKL